MKIALLRWSRFLHKWLGIYVAVLTILWLVELSVLPLIYRVDPTLDLSRQPAASLSIEQVFNAIHSGVYGVPEHLEFRYQPQNQQYLVMNKKDFSILTIDAATGRTLAKELDLQTLLSEKSGLGWVYQPLAEFLKLFFQIFFVILSVTGLYLLFYPKIRKKKSA